MIVNQWVPAAHRGDAIGDSAYRMRHWLRSLGHESELYAMAIDPDLVDDVQPFTDANATRGDITILHYGISSAMTPAFARLAHKRVLHYHNVTPPSFLAPYDVGLAGLAQRGRDELASLVGCVDLALGVSEFNRLELERLGFARTGVLPLALDLSRIAVRADRPALEAVLRDGLMNFLFVGRIAPNKKIEDHIKLAALYSRYVDSDGRFLFVGRHDVVPRYYSMILALAAHHGLRRDRIIFTGAVPDEELAIYYQHAAVYISLSEHEGFCAPLIEAMAAGVPVMAYAAAAIPDTLGGAGIQFSPKDLELAAELLGELAFDEALRARIVAGQRRRVLDFGEDRVRRDLSAIIGSLS